MPERILTRYSYITHYTILYLVLKTKMQASEDAQDLGMWEFAQYLVKHYGFKVFWVGRRNVGTAIGYRKGTVLFRLFRSQGVVSREYSRNDFAAATLPNLVLGCAAEWAHLPITLPLDCWTTKIQTEPLYECQCAYSLQFAFRKGKKDMCV